MTEVDKQLDLDLWTFGTCIAFVDKDGAKWHIPPELWDEITEDKDD